MLETVHADWVHEQVFLLRDQHDFPVVMTQPSGVNGADLLPLSLIGCAAWDVMAILRKQHQPVTGLRVAARSTRDEAPPWRFRAIHIIYTLTGNGIDESHVQRAIALAENGYCSIYATLRDAVTLTSEYIIQQPQGSEE